MQQGTTSYLWVLALISLSIALLNLLPLLPLDGGHILFALIEGARGRFVKREIYERVSVVGLAVVLLLFFIGLSNDIGTPVLRRKTGISLARGSGRATIPEVGRLSPPLVCPPCRAPRALRATL